MRRALTAIALSTACVAGLVTGGGVSHAAPPNGCPYPANNPVMSLRVSRLTVTQLQRFSLGGYFTQNGCGIGGRRVGLYAREGGGSYVYQKQTTTGFHGQYGFTYATDETLDFIVIFSGGGSFPRTVSNRAHISVLR